MHTYLIVVVTLIAIECAGDEVNANQPASTFNSAYPSGNNNIEASNALSQFTTTPAAANALNSLSSLIKGAGSNYIIDASSLGGQVLIQRDGHQLTPVNSMGTEKNNILSQLLQNIAVPISQQQLGDTATVKNQQTNSNYIPNSKRRPPTRTITKTVSIPKRYPATITRQFPIPKPYPVTITRPVPVPFYVRVPNFIPLPIFRPNFYNLLNLAPDALSNPLLLKVLETNPDFD